MMCKTLNFLFCRHYGIRFAHILTFHVLGCGYAALQPQISFLHVFIRDQFLSFPFQDNPPVFQNIGPVSQGQALPDILFHQKDGHPISIDLSDRAKYPASYRISDAKYVRDVTMLTR